MKGPFDEPTMRGDSQSRYYAGRKVFGDRFLLERRIGRGGMGEVWLARDTELSQERAVKFLPPEIATDERAIGQLRREAKAGMELTHPRIVRTNDFYVQSDDSAVVMEYVEGKTLSGIQAATPCGFLEAKVIRSWVMDVVEALRYAHGEMGRVHRDIKPQNIIVESGTDRAKLMDFGISRRISDTHSMVTGADNSGTLAYSSPQQVMGDAPAATDDIYSLGATIYDLLTGAPPFFRGDLRMQVQKAVPPTMAERRKELVEAGGIDGPGEEIPEYWEKAVAACLAKEPGQRPATIGDLARMLEGKAVGPAWKKAVVPPARPKLVTPPVAEAPVVVEEPKRPKVKTAPMPPQPEPVRPAGGGQSRVGLMVLVGVLVLAVAGLGSFVATVMVNNRGNVERPPVPVPAPAPEPDSDPEPGGMTPAQIVGLMKKSIRGGEVEGIDYDDVKEWSAGEADRIDGVRYQTGRVSYRAKTVLGAKDVTAKALIKDGEVAKWVYAKTGLEIVGSEVTPDPTPTPAPAPAPTPAPTPAPPKRPSRGELTRIVEGVSKKYVVAGNSAGSDRRDRYFAERLRYEGRQTSRTSATALRRSQRDAWREREYKPEEPTVSLSGSGESADVTLWIACREVSAEKTVTVRTRNRLGWDLSDPGQPLLTEWVELEREELKGEFRDGTPWVGGATDKEIRDSIARMAWRYYTAGSSGSRDDQLKMIGPWCDYFGKRLSRREVGVELDSYRAKWPYRKYTPENSAMVRLESDGKREAFVSLWFDMTLRDASELRDATEQATGRMRGGLRVSWDADGRAAIISAETLEQVNSQRVQLKAGVVEAGKFSLPALAKSEAGYMKTKDGTAAVWNNSWQPEDSVAWSGGTTVDRGVPYASGEGKLSWYKNGRFIYSYTGGMVRGKLDGKVRNRDADGSERDVWYANGKKLKGPPAGGGFPFGALGKGDSGFMYTREGRVAVWNNSYQSEDSVSWSGATAASNGVNFASGQGTVSWYKNGDYQYSYTGTMVRGKMNGWVTTVDKGGARGEGRYTNGKKTGVWSYRDPRTGRTWTKSN